MYVQDVLCLNLHKMVTIIMQLGGSVSERLVKYKY